MMDILDRQKFQIVTSVGDDGRLEGLYIAEDPFEDPLTHGQPTVKESFSMTADPSRAWRVMDTPYDLLSTCQALEESGFHVVVAQTATQVTGDFESIGQYELGRICATYKNNGIYILYLESTDERTGQLIQQVNVSECYQPLWHDTSMPTLTNWITFKVKNAQARKKLASIKDDMYLASDTDDIALHVKNCAKPTDKKLSGYPQITLDDTEYGQAWVVHIEDGWAELGLKEN